MEKNKTITETNRFLELGKGLLILLMFMTTPTITIAFVKSMVSLDSIKSQYIFLSIFYVCFAILFYIIFRKSLKKDFKDFKKNYKEIFNTAVKFWVKGLIIMMVSNLIINSIINPDSIAANEEANRNALGTTPIITALAMVLFAPFTEELAYRAGFKKAFKSCIPFALVTALFFGGSHVLTAYYSADYTSFFEFLKNWREIIYIIPYGALGYYLAVAYHETNNIFASMSVHALHNLISLVILLLAKLGGLL